MIKFSIIEGGKFNYGALWAQTIFETRHPKVDQTTERMDPDREPTRRNYRTKNDKKVRSASAARF